MLSDVIGQPVAARILRNTLAEQHVTGSFLLIGPRHVGKTFTARQFAAALLCERRSGGEDACGVCLSCAMVAGDRHPDLRVARPTGASRVLRLPQVWPREGVKEFAPEDALLRDLQFGPIRGVRRVFILEDADALNDDTANSLLKVLEEPPSYATFILTAPSVSAVLPTIFSRCQSVRFGSVAADLIVEALIQRRFADEPTTRFLAAYCQGRIGLAFSLASEKELRDARESVLDVAEELCAGAAPIAALKQADELRKAGAKLSGAGKSAPGDLGAETSSRTALADALEIVATWYRDVLALSCGADEALLINTDRRASLSAAARRIATASIEQSIALVLAVRDAVERNANAQIALEALTLRLNALAREQTLGQAL